AVPAHETVVDEGRDALEAGRADRLGRFEGEAAGEDGEPGEESLLVSVEQPVAPVERLAQRLLTGRKVAGACREQLETLSQTRAHSLGGQQLRPRRRQFDRQRKAVQR